MFLLCSYPFSLLCYSAKRQEIHVFLLCSCPFLLLCYSAKR